jgi:hypothetical protein
VRSRLPFSLTYMMGGDGATRAAPHAGTLGLPARRDVADMLRSEQLRTLRMGGSMCNHGMYRWKDFRGRRESRTPYHGDWIQQPGLVQVSERPRRTPLAWHMRCSLHPGGVIVR